MDWHGRIRSIALASTSLGREILPTSVKGIIRRTIRAISGLPARAPIPFATHLPVLIGLGNIFRVQRVLELGCGWYSTLTFLNRSAFPDLVRVETVEHDALWAESVRQAANGDPRLHMTMVSEPICRAISELELDNYDLIFVDDSTSVAARASTISRIVKGFAGNSRLVIHDFEVAAYREASNCVRHRFTFDALNPYTGLLWSNATIDRTSLREVNRLIRKHSSRIAPDNREGWIEAMQATKALRRW